MRLFVAVEVPDILKEMMGKLEAELPSDGLKKVDPTLIHITLKFLGEVGKTEVSGVEEALSGVKFAPFNVQLKGVGVFPNPDYVKVVWAGSQGAELKALASKVEEALTPIFKKEARRFSGHLTLARVTRKIEINEFLEKHRDELFGGFVVNKFVLMESVLKGSGPEYSVVGEFAANGLD